MTIYTLPQALELAKSHGSDSNGFFVLLSLASIHSPYLSNSDKVAELENLLFFAQRCIGAGCEPRVSLPGQDGQGFSLAAPAEADQVEDFTTSYQQHEAHARAVRQGHQGRTSRGLSVEIARFALDNPIFGDDPAELLADLQRCAADCIGAGCAPRFAPPGQDRQAGSFAAPALAAQVERQRYCLTLFKRPVGIWGHFHSVNAVSFFRLCAVVTVQGIKSNERR